MNVEQVYIIFDKDDEPWNHIEQAIKDAYRSDFGLKRKLKVGFSNESFEAWLLAHYLEVDDYESLKADEKLGEHFVDRVQFAVKNGKKFLETIPSDDMRCSPYTNLGWIVNEIYLSK
ncbi:RloB family protein [Limosilactobacillus reuteri]|uniref:RloB family protein n=1 Tax=Limosilactobacillus reuteri TaxID=1598 RepID=UPI000B980036|nr:hypothetical protein CBG19_01310 [Limosilactobacillus reuteri]